MNVVGFADMKFSRLVKAQTPDREDYLPIVLLPVHGRAERQVMRAMRPDDVVGFDEFVLNQGIRQQRRGAQRTHAAYRHLSWLPVGPWPISERRGLTAVVSAVVGPIVAESNQVDQIRSENVPLLKRDKVIGGNVGLRPGGRFIVLGRGKTGSPDPEDSGR